jgi:hypothetical protein
VMPLGDVLSAAPSGPTLLVRLLRLDEPPEREGQ